MTAPTVLRSPFSSANFGRAAAGISGDAAKPAPSFGRCATYIHGVAFRLGELMRHWSVVEPSGTSQSSEDVWGALLLDYLNGADPRPAVLEAAGRASSPAMPAEWFFRSFEGWDWWDQELLAGVERGPVLDLGCGAGRASLYLQQRGLEVTAVDHSAGAIEVSRRRGVVDDRLGDLNDPPSDRLWATVLLLNGNSGSAAHGTGTDVCCAVSPM
jgi:hypothetical protein